MGNINNYQERQKELNNVIRSLSKADVVDESNFGKYPIITDVFKILTENIYTNNFRHDYSEFFPLIVEISKDNKLDALLSNLQAFRQYIEENQTTQESSHVYDSMMKMCVHVNLEIVRMQYYLQNESKIKQSQQDLKMVKSQAENLDKQQNLAKKQANILIEKQNSIKEQAEKLEAQQRIIEIQTMELDNQCKEVSKSVKNAQNEMMAVLSIFSAVVIAFFGGINFITSAITSLDNAPLYKSVFITLIAGFVIFNSIIILMYLITQIIGRDFFNCSCENKKCTGFKQIFKHMPYVFWTNVGIFVLILACVLWRLFYQYIPWL